jgi:hypothetical protein
MQSPPFKQNNIRYTGVAAKMVFLFGSILQKENPVQIILYFIFSVFYAPAQPQQADPPTHQQQSA